MPLLRKKLLERSSTLPDYLRDDEEVFHCEITNEIFKDYEEYCERIILVNSMVWSCAMTGRSNLTYAEALKSEKDAHNTLKDFPVELRIPVIYTASLTKCSVIGEMLEEVYLYIRDRFFIGEMVEACIEKDEWQECQVLMVIEPSKQDIAANKEPGSYGTHGSLPGSLYRYEVEPLEGDGEAEPVTLQPDKIRRKFGTYSRSKNKLYLKQLIEPSQGIYRIKEDILKKYNIHKVKFDQLFVGSPPDFTESNKKNNKLATSDSVPKVTGTKGAGSKGSVTSPPVKKQRQETMAKYLTKSDKFQGTKQSDSMVVKKDKDNMKKLDMKSVNIKKTKNTLVDEMKRIGEEMRQKAASNKLRKAEERIKEREKKKEDNLKFTLFAREWKRIKEDLELKDQLIMPVPTPVDTFISNRKFGEFLEVLEFLKTFSEELEVRNVFPGGITWELLERALCLKEINGPLPDILQILLSSMYRMQEGEIAEVTEREGAILGPDKIESATLSTNVELATVASLWPQQHLGKPLSETQLDSLTLTEILRLHLLASGARTTDARAKWMFQHRGGYDSLDDPGLHLRTTQPHIIKALSMFNICELPMSDILKIFSCLINQILMYSQIRDVIEDRLEKAAKAKYQLKMLVAKERRRILEYETVVAKLKSESALKVVVDNLTEDPELQQTLEKMEKKHRKLSMDYATECTDLKQRQFAYQMYLGSDRAHRRYWLFESVPGLFVEHNEKWPGNCLSNVVRQYPELVNNGADNSDFLRKLYNEQKASCDKENISLMKSPKKNQEKSNLPESPLKGASLQIIMDLNMCTANYSTCKVHGNANKVRWSFYNTSEQINELIKSLNTRGLRENVLRANLEQEKVLIVNHIIQCPVANLTKIQTDVVTDVKKLHKKYNDNNVNLSHPPGTDKSIILGNTLREYILELEDKLSSGYLGNLKVPDRNKWRSAILNDGYDMQCDEIIYGRSAQYVEKNPKRVAKENKNNNLNGAMKEEKERTPEIKTLGEEISEGYEYKYPTIIYKDPGNYLGDTMDLDSEESSGDEDFVVYQQSEQKEQIHNLACALLQVAQSVDTKFLKKPLGVAVDKRNRKESKPLSDSSALKYDKKTHKVYEHWCLSLMAATSYSQVFLHYHTLEDSIIWSQSAAYANCRTCRRRKDPEMILLCDGCNKGNHMYCLKPPLTEVPEGDWYCSTCRPIQTPRPVRNKKRRLFSQAEEPEEVEEEQESDKESDEEEEEEDEEEEEEEEEDSKSAGRQSKLTNGNVNEEEENSEDEDNSEEEDQTLDSDDEEEEDAKSNSSSESTSSNSAELFTVCALCGSGGELISCDECSNSYHIECTEPPLKRAPRGRWSCMDCKPSVPARRTREALASSQNAQDLHHEPRKCAIQSRSRILSFTRTLRRGSVDDETDTSEEPPTRRSRRTLDSDEDLPLHNAALQELLSDVIKHKDSWPFTRPVLQSEVPDYFDIIKQPMDFGTIKSKLNLGDYSSDKEILLDVKLVFNNCDAYNNNNSPVFKAGIRLEKFVEKRCKELCLNIPDDSETNETGAD